MTGTPAYRRGVCLVAEERASARRLAAASAAQCRGERERETGQDRRDGRRARRPARSHIRRRPWRRSCSFGRRLRRRPSDPRRCLPRFLLGHRLHPPIRLLRRFRSLHGSAGPTRSAAAGRLRRFRRSTAFRRCRQPAAAGGSAGPPPATPPVPPVPPVPAVPPVPPAVSAGPRPPASPAGPTGSAGAAGAASATGAASPTGAARRRADAGLAGSPGARRAIRLGCGGRADAVDHVAGRDHVAFVGRRADNPACARADACLAGVGRRASVAVVARLAVGGERVAAGARRQVARAGRVADVGRACRRRRSPTQVPAWQRSVVVHMLLSLQVVPSAASGLLHTPVVGLHVPATWQASSAVQTTEAPAVQTPAMHDAPQPAPHVAPSGLLGLLHTPVDGLQNALWHVSAPRCTSWDCHPSHTPVWQLSVCGCTCRHRRRSRRRS